MAAGATGTPTPLGIPKYNTSADAPSGVGFNSAMDTIDTLITARASVASTIQQSLIDAKGDLIVGSAADTATRLAVGADNFVLTADTAAGPGVKWAAVPAAADPILSRVTTTVDVTNTTAETNLINYSVGGNVMSTNKMVRFTLLGDYLFNSATTDSMTLRIKFGGTTFIADVATGAAISASRAPWKITGHVQNLGATNSQMILADILHPETGTAPTTGIGSYDGLTINTNSRNTPTGGVLGISTLGTIDTTTAQSLVVSAQWNVTTVNVSWRMRCAVIELL